VEQNGKIISISEKASVFKKLDSLKVVYPGTDLERQKNHEKFC
jgi:hypothetical protein